MANAWEIVLSNKMSEPTQEPTTDNRAEWVDLRRKLSRVANFNGFVALTLDAQFYTDHSHVHGLHTFAQTNVSAFSALVLNRHLVAETPGFGEAFGGQVFLRIYWASLRRPRRRLRKASLFMESRKTESRSRGSTFPARDVWTPERTLHMS